MISVFLLLSIHLYLYLSIYLSISLSIYPSFYLSIHPSIFISIYLSNCFFVLEYSYSSCQTLVKNFQMMYSWVVPIYDSLAYCTTLNTFSRLHTDISQFKVSVVWSVFLGKDDLAFIIVECLLWKKSKQKNLKQRINGWTRTTMQDLF